MAYDSTPDTLQHIARVQGHIYNHVAEMLGRAEVHDKSKLEAPEKEAIDRVRPQLKELEHGTPEYKELKRAFSDHHYAVNDHHAEHFANGFDGMTLPMICELLCDWKAATETHKEGDNIYKSIAYFREKHGLSDQLANIFINTAKANGW